MVGRKLRSIELSEDRQYITVTFEDETYIKFYTEGDCCSSSWVEHLNLPGDIKGATFLSAEDSGRVDAFDEGYEYIQVYNTVFHTSVGDIVLEYRNSSNGYYGGCLTVAEDRL